MEGKDLYPRTGKLRTAIERNRKSTKDSTAMEREDPFPWDIHDESLESFEHTFNACLPEEYSSRPPGSQLKAYIEDTLGPERQKRALTAIEFGGPGSRLFSEFSKGFFSRSVGVALTDNSRKRFVENSNHTILAGDILDIRSKDSVYNKIPEALGSDQIDFIICRIELALNAINKHPTILDSLLRKWYQLSSQSGLMFIQSGLYPIDKKNQDYAKVMKWLTEIRRRFSSLEVQFTQTEIDLLIRIRKKQGAPEKLPPTKELLA